MNSVYLVTYYAGVNQDRNPSPRVRSVCSSLTAAKKVANVIGQQEETRLGKGIDIAPNATGPTPLSVGHEYVAIRLLKQGDVYAAIHISRWPVDGSPLEALAEAADD